MKRAPVCSGWSPEKAGSHRQERVLRLSQSALSGQIKRLEDSLGQRLVERRGRKLDMTENGRVRA